MKKILLFAFLLIGTASFGQSKDALKNIKEVTFYGVDYSHVGIIGADESSYKFIETFTKINELMQREYSKYVKPLAKKTKVDILGVDLAPVNAANNKITTQTLNRSSNVAAIEEPAIKEILNKLDFQRNEGYGVILIAEELNKSHNKGIYELVFFDVATKDIVTHAKISGKSRGFGLRNFWANSIHKAISKIKLSK